MTEKTRTARKTTVTEHRPTLRKLKQTDSITARWQKRRIKRRTSSSERDSWHVDNITLLIPIY